MFHESGCRKCEIIKNIILFIIGAFIYMGIEIGFRGYTHWTMGIVGGIAFIFVGGINNYGMLNIPILKQALLGTLIITDLEFLSGVLLNLFLHLNIWNYSSMPFNLYGQICLPFCIFWFLLSIVAIYLDDWLRKILFKEKTPSHKWL